MGKARREDVPFFFMIGFTTKNRFRSPFIRLLTWPSPAGGKAVALLMRVSGGQCVFLKPAFGFVVVGL
ncbi:hypothetical protein [Prevotella sp.]|uniref:hypothetical protein n=1 Tax=Prevotella sp. TaxID=59823 RepID=UPI002F9205DC